MYYYRQKMFNYLTYCLGVCKLWLIKAQVKNKFTIFNKAKYDRSEYKVIVERFLKVGFYSLVDF